MDRAIKTLRLPIALIDRAEAEDRLPPGSGLLLASAGALLLYTGIVALLA